MANSSKIYLLILIVGTVLMSCKTEFEKVRQSNDPQLMYEKANVYFEEEQYERAQILYELAITAFRGQKEAEDLFYKYAQTHFELKQYILAAHYFKNFSNTFINSDKREEAQFMAAYSNYKNSPTYRLDQTYTEEAIEGFQVYVNTYPNSDKVAECNQLIDELREKLEKKMYEQAKLYYDLEQYQSATQTFINVLQDYPDTENAENIRYMIVSSSHRLAANSIYSKRKKRYEETIKLSNEFIGKYPKSSYLKDIREIQKESKSAIKEL